MNSMTLSFFAMCIGALVIKYFAYETHMAWLPLIAAVAMLLCFYLLTACRQVRGRVRALPPGQG